MKSIITFKIFENISGLTHAFSTRIGGHSEEPFSGMNLGLSTNDQIDDVRKNRRDFFSALNIPEDSLAIPKQIHSKNIRIVSSPGVYEDCDALTTKQTGVYLTVQTADCFPVFLFDPVEKVCGLIHSGWRGTAANIAGKTIKKMSLECNSRPSNLLVAIGPGVQQSCYQVDETTASHFSKEFLQENTPGHYLLDIQGTIIRQLVDAGLNPEQIDADRRCTHCESRLFFSYRRDGAQSGRMMGVIGLKPTS